MPTSTMSVDLDRLATLEKVARDLEPDAERRAALLEQAHRHAENFLARVPGDPAYITVPDPGAGVRALPVSEQARDFEELLAVLASEVDRPGLNPASGGHLGYIPGGGLYPSALGDFLADVTNRYSGVFYANPGAVRIENLMVEWMAELVGYPPTASGDLTSGGSIANLVGIVTARDAKGVKAGSIPDAVIYMTEQVHHCVSKAVRIAGLAEAHVREVPMDERFRMSPTGLSGLIEQDRAAGLRPFLVVASAGTTDTGAIDPLESIAAVARDGGLWLHVDAAYGGFFLLSELVRDRLVGLRHADSIVLDPHKGLFLPYGSGAVLVRDGAALHRTNRYAANYMQDAESARDESSPAERSPELTRPFRGLRMWFPLQLFGLAPFRAALDEKVLLARYFQGRLREIPDMEVGPDPQLSVTIFRYRPKGRDPNEVNAELMRILHEDGRVFLSSTMIGGEFWIRLAVLHFRTHRTTIDRALEMISEGIRVLRG